ncbi:hypothetical protein ACWEQO_04850 [Streptomyces sp. NPDC004051]
MSAEQGPSQDHPPRQEQDASGGQSRINIQSGRDTRIDEGAVLAGGDVQIGDRVSGDKITIVNTASRWVVANPLLAGGLAAVLTVSAWTGALLVPGDSGGTVDRSVVDEPGLAGALHTVEQTRVAERLGDAASWCHLVQPGDDTCGTAMPSVFEAKAPLYRERVDEVEIGEPEETGTGARIRFSWKGRNQGTARLVRSGGRWQLDPSDYGVLKLCRAGLFLSLVDARSQELKCGVFRIPTS